MLKRIVTVIAFAFIVVGLVPVATALAQSCCICTDCIVNPGEARCFADIDDVLCADFCAAQECNVRQLVDRACLAPLCEGFPSVRSAPIVGSAGMTLTVVGAWLVGRRKLRRGKRIGV